MRWAQPAPPSRPCPSSRPPPRDKGRLVSPRRASGGRTSLSQGRCAGQKPAELAPRTPYLGSLGLCRGRGAGAAPAAPRGRPGRCSRPKAAARRARPAELERGVQSGGWRRARAGLPGPSTPRLPGAGGPACLLGALYFTLWSRKIFRLTPTDPPYLQKEG